eukprot:SAG11_NODE_14516_length_609_cov_1.113725_2_plen_88_part_01
MCVRNHHVYSRLDGADSLRHPQERLLLAGSLPCVIAAPGACRLTLWVWVLFGARCVRSSTWKAQTPRCALLSHAFWFPVTHQPRVGAV